MIKTNKNWNIEQKRMKGIKRECKYREKLLISIIFIATDLFFFKFSSFKHQPLILSDGNGLLFTCCMNPNNTVIYDIICNFRWGFTRNL